MEYIKISLDFINKESNNFKRKTGKSPSKLIVGTFQHSELSTITSENGMTLINIAEDNLNIIFGLEIIKLNNIDNYFEIQ